MHLLRCVFLYVEGCFPKLYPNASGNITPFLFQVVIDSLCRKLLIIMSNSKSLNNARKQKKDEFYTQLVDIENELKHYRQHFKGKVVLCNCDDPRVSNFFKFFTLNFEFLDLKKLITTCYKNQNVPFEIIDGQQRTISICQFANSEFAFDFKYFHNLNKDEKEKFLSYKLMVYFWNNLVIR